MYKILRANGVELPRYVISDRSSANPADYARGEHKDYVVVRGQQFNKPFVEKPISADDHNIYIYHPVSAGSGSQRLFRKVIDSTLLMLLPYSFTALFMASFMALQIGTRSSNSVYSNEDTHNGLLYLRGVYAN